MRLEKAHRGLDPVCLERAGVAGDEHRLERPEDRGRVLAERRSIERRKADLAAGDQRPERQAPVRTRRLAELAREVRRRPRLTQDLGAQERPSVRLGLEEAIGTLEGVRRAMAKGFDERGVVAAVSAASGVQGHDAHAQDRSRPRPAAPPGQRTTG